MPSLIVTDHESTGTRIREVLTFGGHDRASIQIVPLDDVASNRARGSQVDLIILVLPADRERGLDLLPTLSRIAPGKVIVVGPTADAKLVLRALRSGATDFIDLGDLELELKTAMERLETAAVGSREPGRLLAVFAPNGGSGSSMLAVNLAIAIAKSHKTVGLIDMKLETGDLATLLDLKPTYTLADLCHNVARLDRVMFERSLVKHDSGVHLLAAPQELADVVHVRPEGIGQAVALARDMFPYVLVDVDHSYREEQRVVLRQADMIIVVFRLDFTSLRNVRRTIEFLLKLNVTPEKIRIVVNRHGQPQEVPSAKAEEALGMKISHFIPDDIKAVNRANNHGVPLVLDVPSAKISKCLLQLAQSVTGEIKK